MSKENSNNQRVLEQCKVERVGITRIMNNGLKATIIEYHRKRDITIEFENGIKSYNVCHDAFQKGNIKCPMIYNIKDGYVECINPNVKNDCKFLIDLEDLDLIKYYGYWFRSKNGYIKNHKTKTGFIRLHRLVMNCPDDMFVDHKNGIRTDCRKSNLRICTNQQNTWNGKKSKNNTSGYKGVSWVNRLKKWKAQIMINRKNINIGVFNTKEEAALAYNEKAKELFGEFARLNIIE